LHNVQQRLETRYGRAAQFTAAPDGNRFRVKLRIPAEREEA
jgi:LytS/YehU family sensor histidine kinase